jgi:hypothetical protein
MPTKSPNEHEMKGLGGSNPVRSSSQAGFRAALPSPVGDSHWLIPVGAYLRGEGDRQSYRDYRQDRYTQCATRTAAPWIRGGPDHEYHQSLGCQRLNKPSGMKERF